MSLCCVLCACAEPTPQRDAQGDSEQSRGGAGAMGDGVTATGAPDVAGMGDVQARPAAAAPDMAADPAGGDAGAPADASTDDVEADTASASADAGDDAGAGGCSDPEGTCKAEPPQCGDCEPTAFDSFCGDDDHERGVLWVCYSGPTPQQILDNCTDLATQIPRYCCPSFIPACAE